MNWKIYQQKVSDLMNRKRLKKHDWSISALCSTSSRLTHIELETQKAAGLGWEREAEEPLEKVMTKSLPHSMATKFTGP